LQLLDVFILVPVVWGIYKGYTQGLVVEIVGTVGLVLAVLAGFMLLDLGVEIAAPFAGELAPLLPYIIFIVIFIGVVLAVRRLGYAIRENIRYTLLGSFDSIAGAVVGLLKVAFAVSTIIWIIQTAGIEVPVKYTRDTLVYPVLAEMGPKSVKMLSMIFPFIKQLVESIKHLFQK
jgi:membrane protein required for colicin V production